MKKVFIDAGHGGSDVNNGKADSGALSKFGIKESDRNLVIAKELQTEFINQGVEVIMSRTDDSYSKLDVRCALERNSNVDCCISLHMDSSGVYSDSATGPTILLHGQAPQSYQTWGRNILDNLYDVGITTNRSSDIRLGYMGNLNQNYYFNAYTNSPSMILEVGFISSEKNLNEHIANSKEYAKAICKATCEFLGLEYQEDILIEGLKPNPPNSLDYDQVYERMVNAENAYDNLLNAVKDIINEFEKGE